MANNEGHIAFMQSIISDQVYDKVLKTFKNGDEITATQIQIKCECGYNSANRVLNRLNLEHKLLPTKYEWVFTYNLI